MNHGRETDKIYLHPKINRIICRISINYLSCIMLNSKCYRDEKVFSEINAVLGHWLWRRYPGVLFYWLNLKYFDL
mgnify:CR=1 FL=1